LAAYYVTLGDLRDTTLASNYSALTATKSIKRNNQLPARSLSIEIYRASRGFPVLLPQVIQ